MEYLQARVKFHNETLPNFECGGGSTTNGLPGSSTVGSRKPWLIIGIPTMPRPRGVDYLTPTITALADQFPKEESDPFYKQILVVIMNHGENHVVFDSLKEKFRSNPHFEFVTRVQTKPTGATAKPSKKVQQQTLDVVDLLIHIVHRSHYFLFMEDDFEICSNGIKSLYHLISKANVYHPSWIAIRCSFGLNGILYHNNNDLHTFRVYLQKHHQRRPPDHLVTEFSASETLEAREYVKGRPIVGFRYNLFLHLGKVSTLGNTDWGFPGCFHELVFPTTFEAEAWNPKACPNDDIWPCNVDAKKISLFPSITWKPK
jgi:hypothetical protein